MRVEYKGSLPPDDLGGILDEVLHKPPLAGCEALILAGDGTRAVVVGPENPDIRNGRRNMVVSVTSEKGTVFIDRHILPMRIL